MSAPPSQSDIVFSTVSFAVNPKRTMPRKDSRTFDIVVFGATGASARLPMPRQQQ